MKKYNEKLNTARISKMDEFYTEYKTIEKEMMLYSKHFDSKTIYCNCDDYRKSMFFKFFYNNFKKFNLKKLICTWYKSGICIYDGINIKEDILHNSDGDFRDKNLKNIIEECDIIITNPPFSLFKDFINMVMEYNKKFIILGNLNAIKYKNVFPYIKDNKIFLGGSIKNGDTEFIVPDDFFDENKTKNFTISGINGEKLVRVPSVRWFTNIEYDSYNENEIRLTKKYNDEYYEKIDGTDIINCNKVLDIPYDYNGLMAVPISFIDKYNKNQFDILDLITVPIINDKKIYSRLVIKHKKRH